jgi:hypothetical protein
MLGLLYVVGQAISKISGPAFLFLELKRRNTRMKLYQFQFGKDAVKESQHTFQGITVYSYMRKLIYRREIGMRHRFSGLVVAIALSGLLSGCSITPTVTSFSPQHGTQCDVVTFQGTGMYGSLDQVLFNGVPSGDPKYGGYATGAAASYTPPSFFTASVPQNATRGPIEVHFGVGGSIVAVAANQKLTPDFVVDPNPPTPTAQFSITPLTTTVGGTVLASWTTSNATSVSLDNHLVANAVQNQPIAENMAGIDSHYLTVTDHNACFSNTSTQKVTVNYVQGPFTEVTGLQTSGDLASPNGSCVLTLNSNSAGGNANYKCGSLTQVFNFGIHQMPSVGGGGFSSSSSSGNRSGIVINASSSKTTPSFPVTVFGIDLLNLHPTPVNVAYGDGDKANEPALPVRVFISPDGTLMLITSFTNQVGCTNSNAYCFTVVLHDLVSNKSFPGALIYDGGNGIQFGPASVAMDGGHQVVVGTVNGQALKFYLN